MKSTIFWDITLCSPLNVNRRFGGTYRLHLQGRRISWARNQQSSACHLLSYWFLTRLILRPWRWRRYIPPKRRLTFNDYTALYPRRQYSSFVHLTIPTFLPNERQKMFLLEKTTVGELPIWLLHAWVWVKATFFPRSSLHEKSTGTMTSMGTPSPQTTWMTREWKILCMVKFCYSDTNFP
jgi:hypothetical protein